MTSIRDHRNARRSSERKLKRARHLFILFHRRYVMAGGEEEVCKVAMALIHHGLYAVPSGNLLDSTCREIRFRVARKLWRLDGGINFTLKCDQHSPLEWGNWVVVHGWNHHTWTKCRPLDISGTVS